MNESTKRRKQALKDLTRYNASMYKKYNVEKNRKSIPESEYTAEMKDPANVVEFDNLQTYFFTDGGTVKAVDGISFNVPYGKTIGVVGESGCGKSVTSLSLMRLVMGPTGQIVGGQIRYHDGEKAYDLAKAPDSLMQKIRGNQIAMIFQEPMTSLNPVFRIGFQLDETISLHNPGMTKADIKKRSIDMLNLVGIPRAEGIYDSYPYQLSGGMRQRAMIAMALSCSPRLIIADEPTTALDVTIQAQILDLLRDLKDKIGASIMLITHDLGVVAEMADYVVVMYAGRIIEQGSVYDIYKNPRHPYTVGLMNSRPSLHGGKQSGRLYSIPGQVPNPIHMPNCCYFKERCRYACELCEGPYPAVTPLSDTHSVVCHRAAAGWVLNLDGSDAQESAEKEGE